MKRNFIFVIFAAVLAVSCKTESAKISQIPSLPKDERVILGDERSDVYLPLLKGKKVAIFSNKTGIVGDKIILSGENGEKIEQFGGFSRENVKNAQIDPTRIPFGKDENGQEIAYGEHILDFLLSHGVEVSAIFSPEHGFRANADAGESVSNSIDEKTGVPILSLYDDDSTHSPSAENMAKFDLLLVDLQDVGLRYYTYYISLYYLMNSCAQNNKSVVILDRPNPNGFYVDGEILKDDFKSNVGALPIPTVHGLTFGELARMINGEGWLSGGKNSCDLTVIPCLNYTHETKYPLICAPSPNLKDMRAVYLYASTCFFENTAFSVARGTDFPFEAFGNPEFKSDFSFVPKSIPGAKNPPFLNETCRGIDLRDVKIEDIWREKINLSYILQAFQSQEKYAENPELFFGRQNSRGYFWLDLLSGSDSLRNAILQGKTAEEIKAEWQDEIESFKKTRKPYLLYSETAPISNFQADATFPSWISNANFSANNAISFGGYENQGKIFASLSENCKSFSLYINEYKIDTKSLKSGKTYEIDISKYVKNGQNILQVSDIPSGEKNSVRILIPFPEIAESKKNNVLSEYSINLLNKIIESDIQNGFPSAQIAVIKDGNLIYKNAWGKIQTNGENGKIENAPNVTNETLYDLASVTKMFSAGIAIQNLISQNRLSLDTKIADILGSEFADETISINFSHFPVFPLETMKEWKRNLTVRDVLSHTAGFSAGYPYFNDGFDIETDKFNVGENKNLLFSGSDGSTETRKRTFEQICRTPLIYEPHTKLVYSDIDFMILCFVVEKASGERLDVFLRHTFWEPMNLSRICYRPLENGFSKTDCAATDPTGDSYAGELNFTNCRKNTIQGEVHDGNAFYAMAGISGHAGLFANAQDLAKLASSMIFGGIGNRRFFSRNVIDSFTAPQNERFSDYGMGWWRQAQFENPRNFGTVCSSKAFGHIGFTGTLVFVEPEENLVIVYLTNKINTKMPNPKNLDNQFEGNFYQSGNLGFVPQICLLGLNKNIKKSQWKSFARDILSESQKRAELLQTQSSRKAAEAMKTAFDNF